jgi:hypothetical protein
MVAAATNERGVELHIYEDEVADRTELTSRYHNMVPFSYLAGMDTLAEMKGSSVSLSEKRLHDIVTLGRTIQVHARRPHFPQELGVTPVRSWSRKRKGSWRSARPLNWIDCNIVCIINTKRMLQLNDIHYPLHLHNETIPSGTLTLHGAMKRMSRSRPRETGNSAFLLSAYATKPKLTATYILI